MGRRAPHVHTSQEDIARLNALQFGLDSELRVELQMRDGRKLVGTIVERPTVQLFLDSQDEEGANGQVALDMPDAGIRLLWMDEIAGFVRLGTN